MNRGRRAAHPTTLGKCSTTRGRGHFSSTTNKVLDILEPELVELRVAAGDRITVVNGCSTIDEMMQQIKEGTHLRMCIEFCVEERARATVLKEGWFCEVEPWGSLYDQRQHARG